MGETQGSTKPTVVRSQDSPVNILVCCRHSAALRRSGEVGLLIAQCAAWFLPSGCYTWCGAVGRTHTVPAHTVLGSLAEG